MKTDKDSAKRYQARRQRLIKGTIKKYKTDTILITNAPDIRYFSGSTEGANGLLIDNRKATIFTTKMFEDRVPKEAPGIEVVILKKNFSKVIADILKERKNRQPLGYQGSQMTILQFRQIEKTMGTRKLIHISEAATFVRSVKEEKEITLIRKCISIAEKAFLELMDQGQKYFIGRTERQLAADLEYRMRCLGADRQGFPLNGIIVGSGPNSASCHHQPSDRKVRKGEPVLFDWGAELDGYRSDITRVLFMGKPASDKLVEVYNVVKQANTAGIKAVKAGVYCHKVAEKAWGVFKDCGYKDHIRHGLGHGIGLEIHEQPRFQTLAKPQKNQIMKLRKNMIVTIEPGIYFDGLGGIRIEDDIQVTVDGHKCLTRLPRDLEKMTLR